MYYNMLSSILSWIVSLFPGIFTTAVMELFLTGNN